MRTIWRKLTLNLIEIFSSITGIYFLKYITKIFFISYYFQEKFWECFKVQLSVAVSVYVLSSKGANQLQVLYIRNLRNIQGNILHGILPGSGVPQMYSQHFFFLEICRSFRTTPKKLVLENYVLAYHTTDKNYAKIL